MNSAIQTANFLILLNHFAGSVTNLTQKWCLSVWHFYSQVSNNVHMQRRNLVIFSTFSVMQSLFAFFNTALAKLTYAEYMLFHTLITILIIPPCDCLIKRKDFPNFYIIKCIYIQDCIFHTCLGKGHRRTCLCNNYVDVWYLLIKNREK